MTVKIEKRIMITKNFSEKEMKCKCKRKECDAKSMKKRFMEKLQNLRDQWGKPLQPTSASRCKYWNKIVGGSPKSQHVNANAADFWFYDNDELLHFMEMAIDCGFKGIGWGKNKIHIDDRDSIARWKYE